MRQQTTDNRQRTTDDGQRATDNGRQTTDNGQQTTDNMGGAACNYPLSKREFDITKHVISNSRYLLVFCYSAGRQVTIK